MLVFLVLPCALLTRSPQLRTSVAPASPGTTALTSPPGFEDAYETLRTLRDIRGRPLIHLSDLEKHDPAIAARLAQRVNFNVPTTARGAMETYFGHPTAKFICSMLWLSVSARLCVGGLSFADVFAGVLTTAFWTIQEWIIHDKLLHSETAWFGETVHRWHHELPYYHVSMDGLGLASVWFATVAVLLIGYGVWAGVLGPCLTALAAYTLCGGLYEAAHFLAHTRVPLPPILNRIRRHHTHHHTVSDAHWLAFTVPAVDSLFGTNPNAKDVVASQRRERSSRRSRAAAPPRMCAADEPTPPQVVPEPFWADGVREEVPGLLRMARLNTIPLGAGLVGIGAFGARHTYQQSTVLAARLALSTLLTILVTTGSMLINDYHDHKLGVDNALTKPGRPLVTGEVRPDTGMPPPTARAATAHCHRAWSPPRSAVKA